MDYWKDLAIDADPDLWGDIRAVPQPRQPRTVLGYVIGAEYHDAYWHKDFEVVGATPSGEVVVRDLDSGETRSHRTRAGRLTVAIGDCPRRAYGQECGRWA